MSSDNTLHSADYDVLYDWHIPVGTLAERKIRTDSRREELLHLLHQDNLSPGTEPHRQPIVTPGVAHPQPSLHAPSNTLLVNQNPPPPLRELGHEVN